MKAKSTHAQTQVLASPSWREVNRRMDRQILKIFLPGFRIQSEILTDFRILQLQWIANSSIFCAHILDFACNKSVFAQISDSGKILTADSVNKSQRIRGFAHTHTAHGFCTTYSLENNAFSVLNNIINVALHYYMLEVSRTVLLGCCLTASCLHEVACWQ